MRVLVPWISGRTSDEEEEEESPSDSKPDSKKRSRDDDDDDVDTKPPATKKMAILHPETQDDDPEETFLGETTFQRALKARGLEMKLQKGDGNCLFRAISLQIYGNPEHHMELRERCVEYMRKNEEHYKHFIEEDFSQYIQRKSRPGVHGNHVEIQAVSELYNRPVEVYRPHESTTKPMNIFQAMYTTTDIPIRLSYHDNNHYNAIVDPLVPTAGLGLGLPDLKPGLADQMQLKAAKLESENDHQVHIALQESLENQDTLQRALKESRREFQQQTTALALSDLDATNFELEQKALASSMEMYADSKPAAASVAAPVAAAPEPEYPPVVQELAMNGFEITKVMRAYDLVGGNFDDLLSFLVQNHAS